MAEIVEVIVTSPIQVVEITDESSDHLHVFGEVPSGTLNGSNATFISAYQFLPETLELFVNGLRQKIVSDYNLSGGTTVLMVSSPASTEHLLINYIKA